MGSERVIAACHSARKCWGFSFWGLLHLRDKRAPQPHLQTLLQKPGESRSRQALEASPGQQHPLPDAGPSGEFAEARVTHGGLVTLAQYPHLGWVNSNLNSKQGRAEQCGWPNGNGTDTKSSWFYVKKWQLPIWGTASFTLVPQVKLLGQGSLHHRGSPERPLKACLVC